jgi:hypothetical protein
MSSTALEGRLREKAKVRIGFMRLFVEADLTVTLDKKNKFDTSIPPTGAHWRDLGATGDDTAIDGSKEHFSLKTGVLRTTKFQAVIGMDCKLTGHLHEYSHANVYTALGQTLPVNILDDSPANDSVVSAASNSEFTLDTGLGSGYTVGDRVVVDLTADCDRSLNTARVTKIASNTLTVSPALFVLPTSSMVCNKVHSVKNVVGSVELPHFQLVAVHDFAVGGGQIVYHFPEVAFGMDGFKPDFAGGKENVKLPISATAFGVTDDDVNDTIVMASYDFD